MTDFFGTILPYLLGTLFGALVAAPSTFGDFFRQVGDQWAAIGRWVWRVVLRRRRVVKLRVEDLDPLSSEISINGIPHFVIWTREEKPSGSYQRVTLELGRRDQFLSLHTVEKS